MCAFIVSPPLLSHHHHVHCNLTFSLVHFPPSPHFPSKVCFALLSLLTRPSFYVHLSKQLMKHINTTVPCQSACLLPPRAPLMYALLAPLRRNTRRSLNSVFPHPPLSSTTQATNSPRFSCGAIMYAQKVARDCAKRRFSSQPHQAKHATQSNLFAQIILFHHESLSTTPGTVGSYPSRSPSRGVFSPAENTLRRRETQFTKSENHNSSSAEYLVQLPNHSAQRLLAYKFRTLGVKKSLPRPSLRD